MFTTDSLRVLTVATVNDTSYVVYTDEAYTHAVEESDWDASAAVEYEDYTAWCNEVAAVADADLAHAIIEASDGDVRIIHLGGTCEAIEAVECEWSLGDRVEGGDTYADYDTGVVVTVRGDQVEVSWDSGVATWQDASVLRAEGDEPHTAE
jgi:hypothetical protein